MLVGRILPQGLTLPTPASDCSPSAPIKECENTMQSKTFLKEKQGYCKNVKVIMKENNSAMCGL